MLRICLFFVSVSLIAGMTDSRWQARAAIPAQCPKYECKTVHAQWDGKQSGVIVAYFTANGKADTNSSNGLHKNIFTPSSVEKLPLVESGVLDAWAFDACVPQCGKMNGKWQARQEVARAGMKVGDAISSNQARWACTANGGMNGPTITDPTNDNTDDNKPPGVDDDGNPVAPPPPPPPGGP